jgi:SAM-dependent methyltransferase
MLDSEAIIHRFATDARLPPGYGVGLDERVVEYPWLFAQRPGGRTLDAGSALNHEHIVDRLLSRLAALHIATRAPEPVAFTERGVSYLFCDLRDLPLRDGIYDTVVSISTLEHIGMDNTRYGDPTVRAKSPAEELQHAAEELRRVTRPGGRILVTVPYGRREDHGWFRQFDAADVRGLLGAFEPAQTALVVYAYTAKGWQRSSPKRAQNAAYIDESGSVPAADCAVAARAVACMAVTLSEQEPGVGPESRSHPAASQRSR